MSQLVLLGQREQEGVGGEGVEALQVLCGEGEVGVMAKGGCVVEQGDDRLVDQLVVVLRRLLMEKSPVVLMFPW